MRASDSQMTVSCVYCQDFSNRRVVSDKRVREEERKKKKKKGIINSEYERNECRIILNCVKIFLKSSTVFEFNFL